MISEIKKIFVYFNNLFSSNEQLIILKKNYGTIDMLHFYKKKKLNKRNSFLINNNKSIYKSIRLKKEAIDYFLNILFKKTLNTTNHKNPKQN